MSVVAKTDLSKPTREAIAFAFVAKAFGENRGAMHGLVPLFAAAIHARAGKLFEPHAIAEEVNARFDLNVSPIVVNSMVPALVDEGLLTKLAPSGPSSEVYRCAAPIANSSNSSTPDQISQIFEKFRVYASNQLAAHGISASHDELDEAFLEALTTSEVLQVSLRRDTNAFRGRLLSLNKAPTPTDPSIKKAQSLAFLCGDFINQCLGGSEDESAGVLQASWGALVAEVVLALQRPDSTDKLEELLVIVDGPILLDALDLGDAASTAYASDLLGLVAQSGAQLATFEHLLEEMQGAIRAPLSLFDGKSTASGPIANRLKREPSHASRVRAVLATLRESVENLGVRILDPGEFKSAEAEAFFPDHHITGLRALIAEGHFHQHVQRDLRDATSIAFSMRMRKGKATYSVSEANCVFVTRNLGLARKAEQYLTQIKEQPEYATPVCVSDQQLSGVLWFCTGGGGESLTKLKLTANCASAVTPRTELVSSIAQHLFDQAPERLAEFEALIRNDRASLCMMRETLGVASLATADEATNLLEKMKAAIAEEEYGRYLVDLEAQKQALLAKHAEELEQNTQAQMGMATRLKELEEQAHQSATESLLARAESAEASRKFKTLLDSVERERTRRERALADLRNRHDACVESTLKRVRLELLILLALLIVWIGSFSAIPFFGAWLSGLVAFVGLWFVPERLLGPIAQWAARAERVRLERLDASSLALLSQDESKDA